MGCLFISGDNNFDIFIVFFFLEGLGGVLRRIVDSNDNIECKYFVLVYIIYLFRVIFSYWK